MKNILLAAAMLLCLSACAPPRSITGGPQPNQTGEDYGVGVGEPTPSITESLFNDKAATISEESIRRILDGSYSLPRKLRIAIIKLNTSTSRTRSYYSFYNDEQYLKTQQSYLDLFSAKFKASQRVEKVALIPDMLVATPHSFTSLREAAVRMQADVVVVYAINSDIYARYKMFAKTDIKAFATTQLVVIDVRTGLVPFSAIVTKDALSQRKEGETGESEARARIQNDAVLLTIEEIGKQITDFLAM